MNFKVNNNFNSIEYKNLNTLNLYEKFFEDEKNVVYVLDNGEYIGTITCNSLIENKFDIDSSINKNYLYIESVNNYNNSIFNLCKQYNISHLPIIKNNIVIGEIEVTLPNTIFSMTLLRWMELYNENQMISDYLKKQFYKKIVLFGKYSREIYNYLNNNKLSNIIILPNNELNTILSHCKSDSLIIDCSPTTNDFRNFLINYEKNKIVNLNNFKYISIYELTNIVEVVSFSEHIKKNKAKSYFYVFPNIEQLEYLSYEEKQRISFDKSYRYYYDNISIPEIKKVVKKVFGSMYSKKFIDSRDELSSLYFDKGVYRLFDNTNKYCRAINGCRYTTDKISYYQNCINMFGGCTIYGATVDDENTISSCLQRIINNNYKDYEVINYGARNVSVFEALRKAKKVYTKKNDLYIFLITADELNMIKEFIEIEYYDLLDVVNDQNIHDYFLDEPLHCNHIMMDKIAKYMFETLSDQLLDKIKANLSKNKNSEVKMEHLKLDINNIEVEEYIKYLDMHKVDSDYSGIVQLHGNPFTLGHFKLIQYAAKRCDHLYVLVASDNDAYISFEDRFQMAKQSCAKLKNVTVLKEKMEFGGQLMLPGYFDRDNNPNGDIDISLLSEVLFNITAPRLNIKEKFMGTEPIDVATSRAVEKIINEFPKHGIKISVVPRYKNKKGLTISAKTVRNAIERDDWETVRQMVTMETYNILYEKYKQLL